MKQQQTSRRAGITLIYATVMMVAIVMIISFAVDMGRVQLVKTEIRRAADASARYGAMGLKNILNGASAAQVNAITAAGDNSADGSPVVIKNSDVELLIWNSATQTGTVTSNPALANAVRVTVRRTAANGNPVPMAFARVLGFKTFDVTASSTALYTPGTSATYTVNATGNPFLAGMPAGSQASVGNPHNSPDIAGTTSNPKQSPPQSGVPFSPGTPLTFDGINGNAGNSSSSGDFDADGNPGDIETNYTGNDNHIASMNGPLNSLVGVFLDNSVPTSTTTPASLDFSTAASRDFSSLQPKLKQIFFIGDGRNSNGEVQQFIPPAGATRLYLATWDGWEWNNNHGSFKMTVHLPGQVNLVN